MTRKQVRMEMISHVPTRLATFKKRKASILKKASELSILCAVPVCVVVSDGSNTSSPEIWPESGKAGEIISRFNSLSETEQTKKMVDKNGFVSQQIAKKIQQLERINCENQELEARVLLRNLLDGNCSITDLHDREVVARLQMLVKRQIGEIQKRKEELLHVSQPVPVQTVSQCDEIQKRKEELVSVSLAVPVQTVPESDMACGTRSMSDIVPAQNNPQSDGTSSMQAIVPVQTVHQSDTPQSGTSSMSDIIPVPEKNFSPLVDGFSEKEEFFDLASLPLWWFEGEKEMPISVQKPNVVFQGFSADVAVQQEGSGLVSQNENKDWVSELSNDVLALPDWSDMGEKLITMFDDFGDYQEMGEILWSF